MNQACFACLPNLVEDSSLLLALLAHVLGEALLLRDWLHKANLLEIVSHEIKVLDPVKTDDVRVSDNANIVFGNKFEKLRLP